MTDSSEFIKALEAGNLAALRRLPKGEFHNHGVLGGSLEVFNRLFDADITPAPEKMLDLDEMQNWIHAHILPYIVDRRSFELTLIAAFIQADFDGVTVLEMSIDANISSRFYDFAYELTEFLELASAEYAPETEFRAELGIGKKIAPENAHELMLPFLDTGYFQSIDLYGIEDLQESRNYRKTWMHAKSKGMKLKAHAGEFCPAEKIQEAVEELELDEVQHGISAAASPKVMKFLADNKIRLNICPTSNVMLSRVPEMKAHPAKILYDNGIQITINTDDMIVFNQGVSEEYLNLFNAQVFTASELDRIRFASLK
ncbi:MAG: adenosine deaminase [Planctomycetes bacterium]|nr:adenosine deaminase [Planctomycetota bacterium]